MGANLKEVRERIKSVNNTQQITKAMKMVSAAKLRRAQESITQLRPYAEKLNELLVNILSNIEKVEGTLSKEKINYAKLQRSNSEESMSSIKSCSSIISVQSDGSDFININDLFPKPFAVKGNMI